MTELTESGSKICSGSGATQARDIFNQYDKILKRWRCIYTESSLCKVDVNSNGVGRDTKKKSKSPEKGNLNDIVTWSETAVAAAGKVYNASELEELKQGIKAVQGLQSSLVHQRQGLEQLAAQIGENSTVYQNSRVRIEKVAIILPKRLSYLVEKSDKLVKMVEDTEENQKWVENVEQRYTSSRTQEDHISIRIALSEKEYSINKLFNEYLLLEREVTSSGQSVNTHLSSELKQLKTKWLTLSSDVRRINPVTLSCQVSTMSTNIPKTNSSQSVSSFVSLASLASPTSQSSEQWAAASPTTASTSPMSEEVESIPSSDPPAQKFSEKGRSLLAWLSSLSRESESKSLNVVDTDGVGRELDRFRSLISQLESRKPVRDELVQTGVELNTEEAKSVSEEVERSWSSLQQTLMARKTELTSMLEHADNLNTKGAEVSKWLGKLEKMLTGAGVGKTRDILLRQIREVNQINRELEQYGHHVTLLSQVSNTVLCVDNLKNDISKQLLIMISLYQSWNLIVCKEGEKIFGLGEREGRLSVTLLCIL